MSEISSAASPVPYERVMSGIGYRIEVARNKKGWRQKDLTHALAQHPQTKINRVTIGVWEKGETIPSLVHLFGIAYVTGCDPVWLITGVKDSGLAESIDVARISEDGNLVIDGSMPVDRDMFAHVDKPVDHLLALHYRHGTCQMGTMDFIIIDPKDKTPTGRPETFAYMMSPSEVAAVRMKMVAPEDGRKRAHVENDDLMIDKTLFLDEIKMMGRVVRWMGR
jgi:transcriptional regulator with XRE-family HTH domain